MVGFTDECVDKCLEVPNTLRQKLRQGATPNVDDHMLTPDDFEVRGELQSIAARIVLKILFLARRVRPDTCWTNRT